MDLKVKYRKGGRMPKKLKEKRDQVIELLKEMEVTGNFDFTSAEELDDILESVRRSESQKFKDGGLVENKNTQTTMSEEPIVTQETVAEQTNTTQTEAPKQMFQFDYSGIQEDPIQRSYNEIPVNEYTGMDVPEPQITSSVEAMLNQERGLNEDGTKQESEQQEAPKFENPAMNDLSDKEKSFASEQLVDGVLDAYEAGHDIAKNFVKYNEKNLTELTTSGEIDMEVTFPLGEGEVTFGEYAQIHNDTADQVLTLDPNFRNKVREPMIRIFKKKNWGLSDEQMVIGAFIMDGGAKIAQIIQLNQSTKMVLNALKDYTKRKNADQVEEAEVVHATSYEKTEE